MGAAGLVQAGKLFLPLDPLLLVTNQSLILKMGLSSPGAVGPAAPLPEMLPFSSWERSAVCLGYQLEGTGKAHLCPDGFVAEVGRQLGVGRKEGAFVEGRVRSWG